MFIAKLIIFMTTGTHLKYVQYRDYLLLLGIRSKGKIVVSQIRSLNFTKLSQFQLSQVIEIGWMDRKEEKKSLLSLKIIRRTRLIQCTRPFVRNAEKSSTLKRGFRFPRKELDGLISLIFHLCFFAGKKAWRSCAGTYVYETGSAKKKKKNNWKAARLIGWLKVTNPVIDESE